jgi:hypothetical protein
VKDRERDRKKEARTVQLEEEEMVASERPRAGKGEIAAGLTCE